MISIGNQIEPRSIIDAIRGREGTEGVGVSSELSGLSCSSERPRTMKAKEWPAGDERP